MNYTHFTKLAIAAGAMLLVASCSEKKQADNETVQTENVEDEVHSLLGYEYTDSLMQGSHRVVYTITSEADESLPLVVDEDGTKYNDNRICLEIVKDGSILFRRYFTKADFAGWLEGDFQKYGLMDGLRFNRAEEGKLYFNACVSLPDSDMSCPFILTVGPDGSYTIAPDTTVPDEDEMPSA